MVSRDEFDRHRNCAHCGQRLIYAQHEMALTRETVFTKRCPKFSPRPPEDRHDFLEHRHAYPYRNRRGQNSEGTKRRMASPNPPSSERRAEA